MDIDRFMQPIEIGRRGERLGQDRTVTGVHLDGHTHRLRDDEDIAKDDGSIEQTREPTDRLERKFARDRGRLAALKERMRFSNLEEFYARQRGRSRPAGLTG